MITYTVDESNKSTDLSHHTWSPSESSLRRLWSQVLQLDEENIAPESNFCRMGGDSIDATKLTRLARNNGLALNVSMILSFPRLSNLAHAASSPAQREPSKNSSGAEYLPFCLFESQALEPIIRQAAEQCDISPSNIEDTYPCTPTQSCLMALTAQRPASYWVNHKLELPNGWDVSQARMAGQSMVMDNELLRCRIIQLANGECVYVIPKKSSRDGHSSSSTETPFGRPLFYCSFEEGPEGSLYMKWRVHHAIYDGWSARLMLQAFAKSYMQTTESLIFIFLSCLAIYHGR
ncbi:acetyl-CoA synthetase-like protein [Penicillium longicatenatum]|nr:acetyl-CoA synthetase-like protein [Penicillium longicatenatum]